MKKRCLYCDAEIDCKRLTKKYCNDNCKQLAYFKRNGLQLSGKSEIKVTPVISVAPEINNSKIIQEEIMNEIAVKVIQLIELREADREKNKPTSLCKAESFSIKAFSKPLN
jgi:hypothetical protein